MRKKQRIAGLALLACLTMLCTACSGETKPEDKTGTATAADGSTPAGQTESTMEASPTGGPGGETGRPTAGLGDATKRPPGFHNPTRPVTTATRRSETIAPIKEAANRMPANAKLTDKKIKVLSHVKFTDQDPNVGRALELLRAKYGSFDIESEAISVDQLLTRFYAKMGSGDIPDLLHAGYNTRVIARDMVQDWKPYINVNTREWKDMKAVFDLWKVGSRYFYAVTNTDKGSIVIYNKKMLKGMTEPAELFRQGKWDWNTFAEYAKAMTIKDTSGKVTQYGLALDGGPIQLVHSTGTDYAKWVNGKPVNMVKSAEVARAMNYYIDLNKTGLYWQADQIQAFGKGKIAMLMTGKWVATTTYKDKVNSGEYFVAPAPKDPSTKEYFMGEDQGGYFLPKGAKNPQGAATYLTATRFMNTDETLKKAIRQDLIDTGEGVSREAYELFDLIDRKTTGVGIRWALLNLSDAVNQIANRPKDGNETWAEVAAAVSPLVDKKIEEFMKVTAG